jgi:hypothetical protein
MIVVFISVPAFSFSQNPNKNDTKIKVTVSDTTGLLKKITLALYENGYSVNFKDEQLQFIESTEKAIANNQYSVIIRALIKDSAVIFTGQVANNEFSRSGIFRPERVFFNVHYETWKSTNFRLAWDEIASFANNFGTDVQYLR